MSAIVQTQALTKCMENGFKPPSKKHSHISDQKNKSNKTIRRYQIYNNYIFTKQNSEN